MTDDVKPDVSASDETPAPERPERPPKPEKTPEDLAAIALLDRLRSGEGETTPTGLPLACVVKVIACEDIPKANERYAMVTLKGHDDRVWRMCVDRYYLDVGMNALFVSGDAALPPEDRYRNRDVARVKERVYRFGFGVKMRRLLPIVRRGIYRHNCGLVYPLDDFPELKGVRYGTVCAVKLHIDSQTEIHSRLVAPRPKLPKPPKPPKPQPRPAPKPKPKPAPDNRLLPQEEYIELVRRYHRQLFS